jgi:hypothetical protein
MLPPAERLARSLEYPLLMLRRPRYRLLSLSLGALLAGGACSVPTREDPNPRLGACTEGCPEADPTDGPSETPQISFEGGRDGRVRSVNCGLPSDCNPDPGVASLSCKGTPLQQSEGSVAAPIGSSVNAGGLSLPGTAAPSTSAPPMTPLVLACQVRREEGDARLDCIRSGTAREGEACRGILNLGNDQYFSDCAPGLACVLGESNLGSTAGQCRPYCCFGEGCGAGSWCTPRRLFESSGAQDPLFVPVCAPADNCALLEPGGCAEGQACVLVADQTTSCDVPGKGLAGQACPCAAGFACARGSSSCRAICRIGAAGACGQGLCVGGGDAMPPGFGLCTEP